MSADNWAICPKCRIAAENRQAKAIEAANRSYGKVSLQEWKKLADIAEEPIRLDYSLREDYQIGIDNETGEFSVKYGASCACGFSFTYEYKKDTMK